MKSLLTILLRLMLRLIARLTVWRYQPDIVGITGSVGKTSAKEAARLVLSSERRVRASSKSFNNELGLPLTIIGDWEGTGGVGFWIRVLSRGVWQLLVRNRSYPEVLVLEYGVDHPSDMARLLSIARPHVGVFTAMGTVPAHVEFFPGPDAVFREKAGLITQLPVTGFALLSADDPAIAGLQKQTRARAVTFGLGERADLRAMGIHASFDGNTPLLSLKLTYGGSFVPVRVAGVVGRAQAYALVIGAAVGLAFGVNLIRIAEALTRYQPPAGRGRVLQGVRQTSIIDDSYNASPIAVEEALATLQGFRAKRKVAVLGDMLELGKYTLESHEAVGKAAARVVGLLVTVGLRGKFIAESAVRAGLPKRSVASFMNLADAVRFLRDELRAGDLILVKGSQGVRLEKVVYEIMAEPERAGELLVRQNEEWRTKPGIYEET